MARNVAVIFCGGRGETHDVGPFTWRVSFGRISPPVVEVDAGSGAPSQGQPSIGSGIMGVRINAMLCLALLSVSAASNAKRVWPLPATQLRSARANCECRGVGSAIRTQWNEVPPAFAATKRSSLRRLACAAIQTDD
jgi:hypothetical protein